MIRLLFVGDIMGSAGRRAVLGHLEPVVDREKVDFVVANAENVAGGFGITTKVLEELDVLPVQVWTTGNHVWDKKEGVPLLDAHPALLRPANYPEGNPGRGWCVEETASGVPVAVVNLQGQAMMPPIDNPFRRADEVLDEIHATHPELRVILVDMHAEATSEKQAIGWYLDGRVTAVLGTHTHVPTADEEVLPQGTGYITDLGMTGPYDSVIGMRKREVLQRFITMRPSPFVTAKGNVRLCGAIFEIDPASGRTVSVDRVNGPLED